MPKTTRKLVPQATWSGESRPIADERARSDILEKFTGGSIAITDVEAIKVLVAIERLLGWYHEARKAETKNGSVWRPPHYRLELEHVTEQAGRFRAALASLSRPVRVALERKDVDVPGMLLDLEWLERAHPDLLREIKGEGRGRPKRRAFDDLVSGLDCHYERVNANLYYGEPPRSTVESPTERRVGGRSKAQREAIETVLNAAEIEHEGLPPRATYPMIPFERIDKRKRIEGIDTRRALEMEDAEQGKIPNRVRSIKTRKTKRSK